MLNLLKMAQTSATGSYMEGNVIDGKAVAASIRSEIAQQVAELKAKYDKVSNSAQPLLID